MFFLQMTDMSLVNTKVFFRADLNVPCDENGQISDDTRIKASLPGISAAINQGAAVMIASHLGRPTEGRFDSRYSLAPIANAISSRLGQEVKLIKDWFGGFNVRPGEVVLLENCRFNVGEKENDERLSQKIANLCDVYVNDAFASAHRKEASTHGVAKYAKTVCAGPLMTKEVLALSKALENPTAPLVAVVGGSKVSTKLPVLNRLAESVDHLILGGGIANTFLLSQGNSIGRSLAEKPMVQQAAEIFNRIVQKGGTCPLPSDVVVSKKLEKTAIAVEKQMGELDPDDLILDIGPDTINKFKDILKEAGTIVWNGPVGVFELNQFSKGTKALAKAVEESEAFSIAGGGDTIAAINKFSISQLDYISTAGGAFLEFLEGRTLPAIEILNFRAGGEPADLKG